MLKTRRKKKQPKKESAKKKSDVKKDESSATSIKVVSYVHKTESPNKYRRCHWSTQHEQRKRDRAALRQAASWENLPDKNPSSIHFERISAGSLDDDNLRGAFKTTRDELIKLLGCPSDAPKEGIDFSYSQTKGPIKHYGVRIRIEWNNV